jgi:hypothetical protein
LLALATTFDFEVHLDRHQEHILKRVIYALKQAQQVWNERFDIFFLVYWFLEDDKQIPTFIL